MTQPYMSLHMMLVVVAKDAKMTYKLQVTIFDQSVINDGRLHYIQSMSNQSSDSFTFDVANGISQLSRLTFHFTILPKTLYVETREIAVTEGDSAILLPSHLHVITAYYEDKIKDYLIVDPPVFGRLESSRSRSKDNGNGRGRQLNIFSVDDLEQRTVQVSDEDGKEFGARGDGRGRVVVVTTVVRSFSLRLTF